MYGMATIGTQNLSDYNSRTVVINVITGGKHKNIRNSHSTLKVPYSSLSQTIANITNRGGKIISVSMLSSSPSDLNISTVSINSDSELVIPEKAVIKQEIVKQEIVKQEQLVAEKPIEPKEAVKEVKPQETATEPKSKSKNIAIPFKDLIPKKEKKPRSRKKSS
jgi:CpcD/allophycocyanin linker domain